MSPPRNGIPEKNFLTPKEAANYIGVTVTSIYNWIKLKGSRNKTSKKDRPPVRNFGSKKHPCYRLPRDKFIEWANAETED